ncbi:hypothetical protein AA13595_0575 [Gluconacetobacter johannae DSM 13595]|nr:hypothetical protein AA13595_0575 [Gluconacetobacter johannae DSM 13595]
MVRPAEAMTAHSVSSLRAVPRNAMISLKSKLRLGLLSRDHAGPSGIKTHLRRTRGADFLAAGHAEL